MYINPLLLPETTNREDLQQTIAIFDDDTGQPIDVSYRTLANPGDFTGDLWTVTSGDVLTASASTLTIKDYPFGNEMQSISLTVGAGLAIAACALVTISDATGLNTMTGYVTSYAPASGVLVCQIGWAFFFEISGRRDRHDDGYSSGYGNYSEVGDYPGEPIIIAQLGNGLSVIGTGVVQILIPASLMRKLRHRTYGVGMIAYDGSNTRQLFIGELPIFGGHVTPQTFVPPVSNPYDLP